MSVHVVVLAAGQGIRMQSDRAKVLHEVAGRPLVVWMCALAASIEPATVVVVVGHQAEEVAAVVPPGAVTVLQKEQLGTGHATQIGLNGLSALPNDTIVVLPGDMPLIRAETLERLVGEHGRTQAAATVLTTRLVDPAGYGRVLRKGARIVRIVEHRDASCEERTVDEVNTSIYAFNAADLRNGLARIANRNDQGERYLTDIVAILTRNGRNVGSVVVDASEGSGVNTPEQLAMIAAELECRAASDVQTFFGHLRFLECRPRQ